MSKETDREIISTDDAPAIFERARFDLIDTYYGVKDLFVQAVFVIRKRAE